MFFDLLRNCDAYKLSHIKQYPEGTKNVYSVLTSRNTKLSPDIQQNKVVFFGMKYFLFKLKCWSDWYFNLNESEVDKYLFEYKNFIDARLGGDNSIEHWKGLWSIGYLPVIFTYVDEGSINDTQTPLITLENTLPEFYWLTNFLETTLSANIWLSSTSATTAWNIRQVIESFFDGYSEEEKKAIDFMAHDFSYRGMGGDEGATLSGIGHLSQFKGSDSIVASHIYEIVYGEVTGFSVPATEHSVMCAGGEESEIETFRRLMKIYPTGILSIVSDTWDYFKVLSEYLPVLKDEIMNRDGKIVIRPDSGNPIDIICGKGNDDNDEKSLEELGSLRILEKIFGYTLDSQGLKVLDSHIGLIYGDGMNIQIIKEILTKMKNMGFSPLNIVFGVGSYTYQYKTRDSLSFAFKATSIIDKNDNEINIIKNPKTDPGKKSLTGRFYNNPLLRNKAIFNSDGISYRVISDF